MTANNQIKSGRLSKAEVEENFSDLHPPLTRSEALIEADRCYFCYDAPCMTACPTGIDIPGFIQGIRSDNLRGSAHTILRENIMGGMCARVCPTEILCEEACVRNTHEEKPVEIGLLQRHATDPIFKSGEQLFERAASSGKKIAIVGGGPAGLSCAHRLAVLGHDVVVFNRDDKLGGLNEYGIAAYKAIDDFAQTEVDYILSIGGIEVRNNSALGSEVELAELVEAYDAVFLGVGLANSNALGIDGEDLNGVENAIEYIAELRQTNDMSTLPVGRNVVVIGGGMTAIDVAVQSKRLGAEQVNMVYRRGPEKMSASVFEQALAQTSGVNIHHWASPVRIVGDDHVTGIEFKLEGSDEAMHLNADVVFKAIGQKLHGGGLDALASESGRFVVDADQKTSVQGIWAGGDCVVGGDDLTVSAVQHGKIAAISIDQYLRNS
ncbi:MAG: NAD(P)-dependent oxidoreductase [Gammaproteobacteria bacterium]|jgi:dihydropyrimidine dehydrogenase (NAD+) subunit PreT|nr:NAD(P)-dependent oxidoreductase [Gammaproteobacteria bacterium]